jgi:hypothetical protein
MKEAKPTSAACMVCGQSISIEGGMEWNGEFRLDEY